MTNTPNLNLMELTYDNTKKVKDFFTDEIIGKINSNNTKIDTSIAEKITQVALKSSLPTSPNTSNNLYIVYGDTKNNNGQYRWNGTTYEKISTQLDYATKAEAEAGADNTKVMTPQRVRDFFIANGGGSGGVTNVVFQSGKKYHKFTAAAVTDNFEIPSNLFNSVTDVVELIHGGNIPLIKDENYTLVGNLVTFIGYSLDTNDDIHCLITNTAYSYNALVDKPDLTLKLDTTGDAKDTTVTFTEITTRENLISGDKLSVLIGKIKKWFTDIWTTLADKADKQWMPSGWKVESDLPTTYPRSATTIFRATSSFGGLSDGVLVKTELNNSGIGKQEITRLNGESIKFRIVTAVDGWGAWQTVATNADLEQKTDKGYYTLEANSIYKIGTLKNSINHICIIVNGILDYDYSAFGILTINTTGDGGFSSNRGEYGSFDFITRNVKSSINQRIDFKVNDSKEIFLITKTYNTKVEITVLSDNNNCLIDFTKVTAISGSILKSTESINYEIATSTDLEQKSDKIDLETNYLKATGTKLFSGKMIGSMIKGDGVTSGGILYGLKYIDNNIPVSGLGTIRGQTHATIFSGCDSSKAVSSQIIAVNSENDNYPKAPAYLEVTNNGINYGYAPTRVYQPNEVIDMTVKQVATTDKIDISSTLDSGLSIYASDWIGFQVVKSGNYCNINACFKNTAIINPATVIAKVNDVNFRPVKRCSLKICTYINSNTYSAYIHADGSIYTLEQLPLIGDSMFYYIDGGYPIV